MSDTQNNAGDKAEEVKIPPSDASEDAKKDELVKTDGEPETAAEKKPDDSKPEEPKKESSPKETPPKKDQAPKKDPVKNEDSVKDSVKEKSESPKKESPKKDTKKDEESEDSEDDEPKLGLLEQPLLIESGRRREKKKVERLEMSANFTPKETKLEIPEGKGTKLGDIPRVELQLNKAKTMSEDLKFLHKILLNKPGPVNKIKKNLRLFCGFSFVADSPEYKKKTASFNKQNMAQLKVMCDVLDLEKAGTKETVINRIMEFLLNPQPSGKPLPTSKKKKSSLSGGKGGQKRKRKAKKEEKSEGEDDKDSDVSDETEERQKKTKKPAPKKTAKSKEEVDSDDDDDDDESGEEKDTKKKEESEKEVSEEEEPKKKKAKTEAKKPAKKTEKKEAKKPEKKNPSSKKAKSESESDSASEKEQPSKKKQPPTDDELKDVIKKILDGANLEEVTMKTVCKQVYAKFPEFDLTGRKDFIKSTVKQIIR